MAAYQALGKIRILTSKHGGVLARAQGKDFGVKTLSLPFIHLEPSSIPEMAIFWARNM